MINKKYCLDYKSFIKCNSFNKCKWYKQKRVPRSRQEPMSAMACELAFRVTTAKRFLVSNVYAFNEGVKKDGRPAVSCASSPRLGTVALSWLESAKSSLKMI